MSKYIYTDGGNFADIALNDGERLMQIHTSNPWNRIYCVWEKDETEEEFLDEVNSALYKKYGRRHPRVEDIEDASYLTIA
ncbi:hypothetical protein ACUYFE_07865 [Olegusella massiliensis]|uniref:hypothetical protein n=1 Tax=Olegusella massiliensis TaxID=1776381 RepID=UPI004055802E